MIKEGILETPENKKLIERADVNFPQTDLMIYCNCYQNPSKACCKHRQAIPKHIWKSIGPWVAQSFLRKKNHSTQFKSCYINAAVKTIT